MHAWILYIFCSCSFAMACLRIQMPASPLHCHQLLSFLSCYQDNPCTICCSNVMVMPGVWFDRHHNPRTSLVCQCDHGVEVAFNCFALVAGLNDATKSLATISLYDQLFYINGLLIDIKANPRRKYGANEPVKVCELSEIYKQVRACCCCCCCCCCQPVLLRLLLPSIQTSRADPFPVFSRWAHGCVV